MSIKDFLTENVGAIFTAAALGLGSLTLNNTISLARQETHVENLAEALEDLGPSITGLRSETSQARIEIAQLRGELATAKQRTEQ
jgi:hypothetical protein